MRKAAVLIHSLDAATAATVLAQLSPEEAATIRAAMRNLGSVDDDEQADVAAEFRRVSPIASEKPSEGVALQLSSLFDTAGMTAAAASAQPASGKRFEFLEQASIDALVPYLAREHAQTIAVVLSYLAPSRAAAILAALPPKTQADAIERLAALGEFDPECVTVLEHELAAWAARQTAGRRDSARRSDAVTAILAAASQNDRHDMLANLASYKARLAAQITPALSEKVRAALPSRGLSSSWVAGATRPPAPPDLEQSIRRTRPLMALPASQKPARQSDRSPARAELRAQAAMPQLRFDDLEQLSGSEWSNLVQEVDTSVLVLALAGASDRLADRVAGQLPRRLAKALRRELRRLAPTRLSDVEAAQQVVAATAARRIGERRVCELKSQTSMAN